MQCVADYLPQAGYELYFYDQLGCGRSDKTADQKAYFEAVLRFLRSVAA